MISAFSPDSITVPTPDCALPVLGGEGEGEGTVESAFIERHVAPILHAAMLSAAVQEYIVQKQTSWEQLSVAFEQCWGAPDKLQDFIIALMGNKEKMNEGKPTASPLAKFACIPLDDKDAAEYESTISDLFMRSFLYSEPVQRVYTNNATLAEMVTELRFDHYLLQRDIKKAECARLMEDKFELYAMQCSVDQFKDKFKGGTYIDRQGARKQYASHVHSLPRAKYWAMARAAANDPEKEKIFITRVRADGTTEINKDAETSIAKTKAYLKRKGRLID
jgi:hypothetical protein